MIPSMDMTHAYLDSLRGGRPIFRTAAEELVNGTDAYQSGENGYYTYIYNPPARYAWQRCGAGR